MNRTSLILWVFLGIFLPLTAGATLLDEIFDSVKTDDLPRLTRLLDRGMDASSTDKNGETLLMYAARDGKLDVARLLIARKANLKLAAFNGHLPIVKILQASGAEVDKDGWAPLHYAAFNGNAEICKLLMESKANIDARAPNQMTPLMIAARNGHTDTVKLLLNHKADPNLQLEPGVTALELALRGNHTAVAEVISRAGAR
jgi:ankyrin repeat protein